MMPVKAGLAFFMEYRASCSNNSSHFAINDYPFFPNVILKNSFHHSYFTKALHSHFNFRC